MSYSKLIEALEQLKKGTEKANFKKSISRLIRLLEEIEDKNIAEEEKLKIQESISPYLENIQTQKELKFILKKLRKLLMKDFGFVPLNYYMTLGIGLGLAMGTSLGITFGAPYENGIIFGPMTGSGIGLIAGLIVGMFLDKKKEAENLVLKNL